MDHTKGTWKITNDQLGNLTRVEASELVKLVEAAIAKTEGKMKDSLNRALASKIPASESCLIKEAINQRHDITLKHALLKTREKE